MAREAGGECETATGEYTEGGDTAPSDNNNNNNKYPTYLRRPKDQGRGHLTGRWADGRTGIRTSRPSGGRRDFDFDLTLRHIKRNISKKFPAVTLLC